MYQVMGNMYQDVLIASKMWWLWHKSIVLITQTQRMLKSVDQVKQAYMELRKTDIVKGALTNECRGTTEDISPSKVNEMCYHVAVTLADYSRIFHDFLCWLLFLLHQEVILLDSCRTFFCCQGFCHCISYSHLAFCHG